MKPKIKVLSVKPLKYGNKKFVAEFEITKPNGKKTKRSTKFGAKGMSDYTKHKTEERRNNYIKRHKKDLRTNDPTRAGYLSMYILWNKKTFKASLADYKRRLNIYNKTGKFPKSIEGSSLKSKFGNIFENTRIDLLPFDIQEKLKKQYYAERFKKGIEKLSKSETNLLNKMMIHYYNEYPKSEWSNIIPSPYYNFKWFNSIQPDEKDSSKLIEKASNVLTKNDLVKKIWYNFLMYIVEEFDNQDPNNDEYLDDIQKESWKISEKAVIKMLKKLDYYADINQPYLDNKQWYNKALIWLIENEPSNSFGKSKKSKSETPDNVKNPKLYLKIKEKIQKDVKAKKRRWGAYDSGRLVREYKQEGGKYSGTKKSKTQSSKSSNLDRWYREEWIDACAWPKRKSCGRTKASIKSKVTYCRPSVVIDRNTPKTVQELSKAQIKKRCAKKSKNPKKIIR